MKKWMSLMLAGGLCISTLTGCSDSKSKDAAHKSTETDYEVSEYEYITRDLPEPKYIEAADAFSGGDGTEGNPYQIASAAELVLLEELIRKEAEESYQEDYAKASYVLTADIVLNDISDFAQWPQNGPEYSWRPIGQDGLGEFKGNFDGNGHVISGMYINLNNDSHEKAYGLFDTIRDAKVQNVNLESSYICVSGIEATVGGVVANVAGESLVSDCTSNAVIEVFDGSAGGVAGSIWGGRSAADEVEYTEEDDQRGPFSTVKNCSFSGTIRQKREDSMSALGGVAAGNGGNLENCVNYGTIYFGVRNTDRVGGVVASTGGMISGCENSGTLECTLEEGTKPSDTSVCAGGIAGKMFMSSTGSKKYMSRLATITSCKNTGTVTGTMSVGGIVGEANNFNNHWCMRIENCTNTGEVTSLTEGNVGGIAGNWGMGGVPSIIETCTNTGRLFINNRVLIEEQRKEIENSKTFTLSRIIGGIVGKVGKGLYLSTDNDEKSAKYINSENAFFQIIHCKNTGEIEINDPEEYKDQTGKIVYRNYIGGILGNASGEKEYSVRVEDCSYLGTEYEIGLIH